MGGDVAGLHRPALAVEGDDLERLGQAPFALLGGVEEVWSAKDDVPARLARAIAAATTEDNRAALGKKRGGRRLALDIAKRVLAESAR